MGHRLITIEVANRLSRPLTGMANWLRRHASEIQQCKSHRQAIDELAAIPLTILPVNGAHVSRAADLSIQFGLLTNDALIVAVMQDNGLNTLASLDVDFDRVPGITRYAPV
jgi:predicted nucleic acid-binding protein